MGVREGHQPLLNGVLVPDYFVSARVGGGGTMGGDICPPFVQLSLKKLSLLVIENLLLTTLIC